jgi:hypothetical protein
MRIADAYVGQEEQAHFHFPAYPDVYCINNYSDNVPSYPVQAHK